MTEHRYREQLPFVHMAGLNYHMQWHKYIGEFMCKGTCVQVRCFPGHKIAYMRLNPDKSKPFSARLCQNPWVPILLVRHRKAAIKKQVFECPYCVGWSPILYWMSPSKVRCRHCCPLPHAIQTIPIGVPSMRKQLSEGRYGQVAEHLMAGGQSALAGMIAMELEGMTAPRLATQHVTGRDVKQNKALFWRRRPKVWLRSSRRLLYAEGRLWVRARR